MKTGTMYLLERCPRGMPREYTPDVIIQGAEDGGTCNPNLFTVEFCVCDKSYKCIM